MEDGEVEGETKTDGVCGGHVGLADLEGSLVGVVRALHDSGALLGVGNLGEVAEVVTLHLQVEDLAVGSGRLGDQVAVQKVLCEQRKRGLNQVGESNEAQSYKDFLADGLELVLDLATVLGSLGLLGI